MGTKSFSEQVKTVRTALHLSQEELAQALGVSFASVNRWENERTSPSKLALQQFDKFCKEQREKAEIDEE